jgi:hypothetical protein
MAKWPEGCFELALLVPDPFSSQRVSPILASCAVNGGVEAERAVSTTGSSTRPHRPDTGLTFTVNFANPTVAGVARLRLYPHLCHTKIASLTESRSDGSSLPGMAIPGEGHTHEPSAARR